MVKGISRQVIVVHSPDPKLFEQAIFILKDGAIGQEGVTNESLLREADRLIRNAGNGRKKRLALYGLNRFTGCWLFSYEKRYKNRRDLF